jgi:ethanolamine utilization microcompartment shell protein EutS
LWQENQQMSANKIAILTQNQDVKQVNLEEAAIVVEMVDSIHFNQITGKEIVAFVDSSQIKRVEVNGNAETIYYAREDSDSVLLGANRTESSKVVIHFIDKKIDRVVLTAASSGVFYPLHRVTDEKTRLERFFWAENLRPLSKEEVFLRFPKGDRPKVAFRKKTDIIRYSDEQQPSVPDDFPEVNTDSSENLPSEQPPSPVN